VHLPPQAARPRRPLSLIHRLNQANIIEPSIAW
jgi:hypothetical protein